MTGERMDAPNQQAVREDGSGPGLSDAKRPAPVKPAPAPATARPGAAGGEPVKSKG